MSLRCELSWWGGYLLVGSGCPPLDEMDDRRCDHSSCERSVDRFPVGILPIRLTKVPSPYEARVIILAGPLTLGFTLVVKGVKSWRFCKHEAYAKEP